MPAVENRAIPRFLLGSAYTVTITPQDVSSTGTFSDNAVGALNFYGLIEEDGFEHSLVTQNFASVTSFQANPVPLEYEATYILTELMTPRALYTAPVEDPVCYGNILESALRKGWYHKIVVTVDNWYPVIDQMAEPADPDTLITYTFYALMTSLRRSGPRVKNTMQATFKLIAVSDGLGGYAQNPVLGPA